MTAYAESGLQRSSRLGAGASFGSGLESPIKLSPIDLVLHVRMRTTL
ncbi:hypothetical protein ARZXY2_3020 [Arthrobacter sp. ZXY-2]|nr:hypothetical protein ARZXY2_3020 [Arthrobacter sp. ZXY-2]